MPDAGAVSSAPSRIWRRAASSTSAARSTRGCKPRCTRELVLVNVEAVPPGGASLPDWATAVRADVCRPGDALRGERFDLVYSNSVIEHVGGHRRRAEFADVARALADRYWVQTPSRRFPIEPHFLFPGFVLLPLSLKVAVARYWPLSWLRRPGMSREEALAHVLDIELLTPRLMRSYFPDGHVTRGGSARSPSH